MCLQLSEDNEQKAKLKPLLTFSEDSIYDVLLLSVENQMQ